MIAMCLLGDDRLWLLSYLGCTGSFYRVAVEHAMLGFGTVTELTRPSNGIKYGFYVTLFYFFTTGSYPLYPF
jgi:hypothetical protein